MASESPTYIRKPAIYNAKILPAQLESVSFGINDFYYIEGWTVEVHNQAHISDLPWLNAQVKTIAGAEPDRKLLSSHITVRRLLQRLSTQRILKARSPRASQRTYLVKSAGLVGMLGPGRSVIRISTATSLRRGLGSGCSQIKGATTSSNQRGLMQRSASRWAMTLKSRNSSTMSRLQIQEAFKSKINLPSMYSSKLTCQLLKAKYPQPGPRDLLHHQL